MKMILPMEERQQMALRLGRPVVLGIGGLSGSGKTTLAREMAAELDATLMPLDHYYRDLGHLAAAERPKMNFDHPDAVEHELLVEHVSAMMEGRSIERQIYDFSQHTRVAGRTEHITPGAVVIVEGIFALHYAELRALYDFSVYVDCPEDICYTRRLARDVAERGRTPESVKAQWEATAKEGGRRFVMPSAEHATLRVDATGALDWSVEQVFQQLHAHGVL